LSFFFVAGDTGTQGWRCPERLNGKLEDKKSDSFGLGLITHVCLTGLHPFGKLGNLAECEKHIERNLLNLSKELTLVAADFVRQLLNPIPSERYVVIRIIIILL
jgi:serine/threonine protein kinase